MRPGYLQGQGWDATGGVAGARWNGPGSGSAVFLIHPGENSGRRPLAGVGTPAGVSQLRNGYYHAGYVNVL